MRLSASFTGRKADAYGRRFRRAVSARGQGEGASAERRRLPRSAERLGVQSGEFLISVSITRLIPSCAFLKKTEKPNRRRMHQHTVGFEPTMKGMASPRCQGISLTVAIQEALAYAAGSAHAHRCALTSTGKKLTCKHILPFPPNFCTEKKLRAHLSPQLFCLIKRPRISARKRSGESTSTRGPKENTRTSISSSSSES